MKRVLFLIHDLGGGGAEKVLVNLVNHLDHSKFDITVVTLFGGGVNERNLVNSIKHYSVFPYPFPGNSRIMRLFTPPYLHKLCVKEKYDIEVAFLEGPDSRIISGCPYDNTKLYCWIHSTQHNKKQSSRSFRSFEESKRCYKRFKKIICVSKDLKKAFQRIYPELEERIEVYYNTIETDKILKMKDDTSIEQPFNDTEVNLIAVGKICRQKGFDRLARILKRLRAAGFPVHIYAVGTGPDQKEIIDYLRKNSLEDYYTFLGYQDNPYKYVYRSDLFVCASLSEGFSTATTEALVVGTPVCTVDVSGMKELLGENGEWGIVTDNNEDALYEGIKLLLDNPRMLIQYKERALERGAYFSMENTVKAIQDLFEEVSYDSNAISYYSHT